MKIPVISSNSNLFDATSGAVEALNAGIAKTGVPERSTRYSALHLDAPQAAIEHINYQTPSLIVMDFASEGFDVFGVMLKIVADPWLNFGGIIALFDDSDMENKINELLSSNIIISLSHRDVSGLLPKILRVVHDNSQILFQRAIQSDLVSSISGGFELVPDTSVTPCYANLIANYLYNMGFIDAETKGKVSLSLLELLLNAIEHGTCGITSEDKTKYLEEHGSIHGLIAERLQVPEIASKKVIFEYEIDARGSIYHIKDEGDGFDWRKFLDPESELDIMSFHGRGIMISNASVDEVKYNERGNEVTVSVNHMQNTTNTVPAVFLDQEVVLFQPGDMVFREGEESDFLYYIAEGEYRVEVEGKQVATISPTDILMGEMSFLLQETRSADVVASTPGKLIKISSAALVNSIKEHPYYGLFLAKLLAQRLYDLARVKVR